MCFFLVVYVRDRVCISSLHVTEEFFVNNFCKYFFTNCRSASPSSPSLLLICDNALVEVLRRLTFIELFLNSGYYGKHCCFDLAFNSKKEKIRSLQYFFCLILKSATLDHFSSDDIGAVKNEAILKILN